MRRHEGDAAGTANDAGRLAACILFDRPARELGVFSSILASFIAALLRVAVVVDRLQHDGVIGRDTVELGEWEAARARR